MNETTTNRTVIVERLLPHAPEKVWRALTQSHLLDDWLMKNDFQPMVGHRFNFRSTPMPHWNGIVDCEVLEVEPHSRLTYRWNASGDEAATGVKTVVTWTLTPVGSGTQLRMEQAGFRPNETANYQGAKYGWERYLAALENVVAGLD